MFAVTKSVGEGELFEAMYPMLGEQQEFSRKASAHDGVIAFALAWQVDADIRVVRFLVSVWPALIRSRDENGRTFLHLAVLNGASYVLVTYLALLRTQAVWERDDQGFFPIH